MGRSLLELGGNNAIIVDETRRPEARDSRRSCSARSAPPASAAPSTRRLFVHEIDLRRRARQARQPPTSRSKRRSAIRPQPTTLMGPLNSHGRRAGATLDAVEKAKASGGKIVSGGKRADRSQGQLRAADDRHRPAKNADEVVQTETFAPILYVMPFRSLDEAIALQNGVPQGLSSSIFTDEPQGGRSSSCRRRVRIAASPTSTSAPPARRSAARSAARRKPAAAASRARMRGRPTCAGRPTRSTIPMRCRWRRASSSICDSCRHTRRNGKVKGLLRPNRVPFAFAEMKATGLPLARMTG